MVSLGWIIESLVLVFGSALVFLLLWIYYQYRKNQKQKPSKQEQNNSEPSRDRSRMKDEARQQMRIDSIKTDMDKLGVGYVEDTIVEGIPVQLHIPDKNLVIIADPNKSPQFSEHRSRVIEGPAISDKTGEFSHALYDPTEVIDSDTTESDLDDTGLSPTEKRAFAEFGIDGSDIQYRDTEDIQSEIRAKLKAIHPDNVSDEDNWSIEKFQEKKHAYDVLKERYF